MEKKLNAIKEDPTLRHVSEFQKIMEDNEIMLSYCGDFSQELNKTLLSFTERKFKSDNMVENTRRKIFNIMVEVLQNISKNKIERGAGVPDLLSLFVLGAGEDEFRLVSINLIHNQNIEKLRNRIDQINSLDREGLKLLYKEVRLNSSFSDKSGAGIGLIDIARKSENRLEYVFTPITDQYSDFTLLIRISKEKTN